MFYWVIVETVLWFKELDKVLSCSGTCCRWNHVKKSVASDGVVHRQMKKYPSVVWIKGNPYMYFLIKCSEQLVVHPNEEKKLTGEGGCCLNEPTKFFPFPSAFACALCVLGPSLSSVAKWNSWGWVRLSTADLVGMYDCPARAFFMEILFLRSISIISFCFWAMTCSSLASRVFCAWIVATLGCGALLQIEVTQYNKLGYLKVCRPCCTCINQERQVLLRASSYLENFSPVTGMKLFMWSLRCEI